MINTDQVSLDIPKADIEEIKAAIQVLKDKLMPHMVNLSNEDRKELPKMGDKTFAFVSKSYSHMLSNPSLVPPYVNAEELKVDLDAVDTLKKLHGPLQQLANLVDDTMMLSGSEAYVASLAFYNYTKGAERAGVPGADMIYADLKKRFPGGHKKSNGTNE